MLGVLFRPAATFDWARQNLRFGYWWILICVFTLDIVTEIYSPALVGQPAISGSAIALMVILYLTLLFDLQAALFLGVSRAFRWRISWPEALKYVGLAWSLLLIEDIFTFFPALKGWNMTALWISVPFLLWYLVAFTIGVKRLSGFSGWKAFLLVALATLPWQVGLFWLNWNALHS